MTGDNQIPFHREISSSGGHQGTKAKIRGGWRKMDAHAQMHQKKQKKTTTTPTTSIFENQSQRLCKGFGFFEQQSLKKRNQQKKQKTKTNPQHVYNTASLTWSSCLLKLLKMSCLLTWKTGFPSLKTACMTTPREYMSEAASQLTDSMYSGARYSGLGRQSGGRLGCHSLHVYLGYRKLK